MNEERPHRPLVMAAIEKVAPDPAIDSERKIDMAHRTAAAVINAGERQDLRGLADKVGLETLAELWHSAEPSSLPGALWMLYVLRTWCQNDGDQVARLYRAGRALAPVDEVVAGAPEAAGPDEVGALADEVLGGMHRGDFAVALERAAAFFRIIAAGRDHIAPEGEAGDRERDQAERNRDCSRALADAAAAWRAGTLS